MGIFGTDSNRWVEITREEREFCAVLFNEIRAQSRVFVNVLNKKLEEKGDQTISSYNNWDVGFEVALYRDLYFAGVISKESKKKYDNVSSHRKFDIAMFKNNELVLIEAKAHGGFNTDDIDKIFNDRLILRDLQCFRNSEIYFFGLHSSKYNPKSCN